jgi:hypothetical protein
MQEREQIIASYITAYNNFDVERMLEHFDENIIFENITGGKTNMRLEGLEAFKEQAERSKNLFVQRTQTVMAMEHRKNESEALIDYHAILAIDLGSFKKGDELKLEGKSVFTFSGNKIIALKDIS